VTGRLITLRRGDAGYEAARRAACWNADLPDRFPDVIALAYDARDVMAAVRLARANGWIIGVRSGGHSWPCNHVREGGMLLDVSRLDCMLIDAEARRASVGPGCRGHEVDAALAQRKLFFPVGHCRNVGLGGYLLQGGYGWHSRTLGNACESVIAIDYVDATGELRHASPEENADIYWAARGAGPGFFGVVTRYHLKLYPRPPVIGIKAAWYPIRQLEPVIRWMSEVGPDVPRSIELMALISRKTDHVRGPGITLTAPVFAESWRQARADLAFMKTRPRGASFALPFVPMKVSSMTRAVMGHYPRGAHYAVDNMWTHAGADDLVPAVRRIADTLPAAPSHMLWMNWQPPAERPDMACSLDDRIYIALYGVWQRAEDEAAARGWAQGHMRTMAPLATGIQLADENLGRRPAPFLAPAAMARLDQLRARHDPEGRFHPYMGRL
jgi:FAD/FMN-containing dehydrogenase